jgi:antitoxin component YwqK of YwqJK toxin-antitoxin module
MEECYICLQEETSCNEFLPKQICKCKSLRVHQTCFKKLNNIYTCSVCKEYYENIYIKDGKNVFVIRKGRFVEKYKINSGGHKNGYYSCYYPDGTVFMSCFFIDGLRQGTFNMYYPNGLLKESCLYIYGKREGDYKSYHPNGILFEKICYRRNIIHGKYEIFDKNGNYFIKTNSYKGFFHKKMEIFYLNQTKYLESNYKKGLYHGRIRVWDEDECITFDGMYKDGNYIGEYKEKISKEKVKEFFSDICYKSLYKILKFCSRKKKIFCK